MKLCRFELIAEPGRARSGIVYGPKVYETDGANPIGVHEWSDVRLLAPIGQPSSIRLFSPPAEGAEWEHGADVPCPPFQYLNPASLVDPGFAVQIPSFAKSFQADACLALVIAGSGWNVPVAEADGLVLGLSLACSFYVPGETAGRARDAGFALGPAITTPDELDDAVTEDERGRRYRFPVSFKVNNEVISTIDLSRLPNTFAEVLSFASESCPLHQGDIVAISLGAVERPLEAGDQVQAVCEKLGTLTARIVREDKR